MALSLLAAAAAFVIVFEFLALQLQGSNLAGGGQAPGLATTAARHGHATPIVSRTSGASTVASSAARTGSTARSAAASHSRRFHPVTTRASGGAMRAGGEDDDL